MTKFESLALNVQALILAKLGLEIVTEECANLSGLADKRRQDIAAVWREVCRKAGQGVCTIPEEILYDPK